MLHFFSIVEGAQHMLLKEEPRSRLFLLADNISCRSHDISGAYDELKNLMKVTELCIHRHDIHLLCGPLTEYDKLLNSVPSVNYSRLIGSLFRTSPSVTPPFVVDRVQPRASYQTLYCRHENFFHRRGVPPSEAEFNVSALRREIVSLRLSLAEREVQLQTARDALYRGHQEDTLIALVQLQAEKKTLQFGAYRANDPHREILFSTVGSRPQHIK